MLSRIWDGIRTDQRFARKDGTACAPRTPSSVCACDARATAAMPSLDSRHDAACPRSSGRPTVQMDSGGCTTSPRVRSLIMIARSIVVVLVWGLSAPLNSQVPQPATTVFQNVRIFDGKGSQLSGPSHVLVRENKIERISSMPIAAPPGGDTTLSDGGGRTMMPGLIDAHWHTMLVRPTPAALMA